MEARAIWRQRLSFTGAADSGFSIVVGTDEAAGGDNDGVRPMELIAIGLASCTSMDVVSVMVKKRQVITAFEAQFHGGRAAVYPKVFTDGVIEYFVTGRGVDETALVRSIELSVTRYCPVYAMLSKVFPIELRYHIYEDQGDGAPTLVKSGVYVPVVQPEE
jgi:putative redox protein